MSLTRESDSDRHLSAIHARLEHIGLTPAARDWLIKALHPAATHECPGIPDPFEGQVITPDYRDTLVVGPDPAVTGDWDCLILQAPGDNLGFIVATGPSGTDFTSVGTVPPVNCTAVATYNQGCVANAVSVTTFSSVAPAVATRNNVTLVSEPWQWRRRYAGITAYMTASALYDQGTVFASSFSSGKIPGQARFFGASGATSYGFQAAGGLALAKPHDYVVPLDETSLQLLSPKPYVAPARHGAYVPSRFMGFDMTYTEAVNTKEAISTSGTGGGQVSFLVPGASIADAVPASAIPQYLNGNEQPAWPSLGAIAPVLLAGGVTQANSSHSDMTVQVIIFRGLANQARITVRSYFGLEVVPRSSSTFRQFAKPAAAYSEMALRTYAAVVHELAYCYPASYNSWGDLMAVIHKVASFLYPPLRSMVGSIPVVGPVAKAIGDAVLGKPRMSEVQRVAVSDPRPASARLAPREATPVLKRGCPQCAAGLPHKHRAKKAGRSVSRKR